MLPEGRRGAVKYVTTTVGVFFIPLLIRRDPGRERARALEIANAGLEEGQHRNPTERLDYFTTAYFHRPSDAIGEVA